MATFERGVYFQMESKREKIERDVWVKIFNQGCVNIIWSRGSISVIFANGYHEFVCGYQEVVRICFL